MRDYFSVVPCDSITRQQIIIVNKRNAFILFVLLNIFLYDSWLCLPVNVVFTFVNERLTGLTSYRTANMFIHAAKFLLRFSRPLFVGWSLIQLAVLRLFIELVEQVGLDERYLKLLFFDISDFGSTNVGCSYRLWYYDWTVLESRFDCEFTWTWQYILGYLAVGFQVLTLLIVALKYKNEAQDSMFCCVLMIFEEICSLIMLTTGAAYGFYKDLLLVVASNYAYIFRFRVPFEQLQ